MFYTSCLCFCAVVIALSTSLVSGSIRLVRNSKRQEADYEGRIEVYHNKSWLSVSHVGWSKADATVACQSLGYDLNSTVPIATRGGYYGQGTGSMALTNIQCNGDEASLLNCSYEINRRYSRRHYRDGGLRCVPKDLNNSSVCRTGSVRLLNGTADLVGRVDVCVGNEWGTIVRTFFDHKAARVICRQLGYYDKFARIALRAFTKGSGPVLLSRVNCSGLERNILDCEFNGPSSADGHDKDTGVVCYAKPKVPNHCTFGDVRLVNGTSAAVGRVELCVAGVWGTIADDLFDKRDATVICRQLGFSTANSVAFPRAYFGQGTGPIYLKNLQCSGSEESILDCPYSTYLYYNTHREDAGVKCEVIASTEVLTAGQTAVFLSKTTVAVNIQTSSTAEPSATASVSPTQTGVLTEGSIDSRDDAIIGILIGVCTTVVLAVVTIAVCVIAIHQINARKQYYSRYTTDDSTTSDDINL